MEEDYDLSTIEGIEDVIVKSGKAGDRLNIRKDTYGKVIFDKDGFQSVDTSAGEGNDCLVNAFLLCCIPSFRTLESDLRNKIGGFIRRDYLPTLDVFKSPAQDYTELLESREALDDNVARIIGKYYNINIVLIQRIGSGISAIDINNIDGAPFIFIYNPGDNHFRAIRRVIDNQFLFPYEEGQTIADRFSASVPDLDCIFKNNEIVEYINPGAKGSTARRTGKVIGRRFDGDPPVCINVTIQDSENYFSVDVSLDKVFKIGKSAGPSSAPVSNTVFGAAAGAGGSNLALEHSSEASFRSSKRSRPVFGTAAKSIAGALASPKKGTFKNSVLSTISSRDLGTISSLITETMEDATIFERILSDEHILNFNGLETPEIPKFLGDVKTLNLLVYSGDFMKKGKTTIELHPKFNIHICKPRIGTESTEGADQHVLEIEQNLQYIQENKYHKAIICFVDPDDSEAVKKFINVFRGKISLMDTLKPNYKFYHNESFFAPLLKAQNNALLGLNKDDGGSFIIRSSKFKESFGASGASGDKLLLTEMVSSSGTKYDIIKKV